MSKNQARKRDSGTGCVTCKRGRKNPYMALVSEKMSKMVRFLTNL